MEGEDGKVRQHKRYSRISWAQKHKLRKACWEAGSRYQSSKARWCSWYWWQQRNTCMANKAERVLAFVVHHEN